MELALVTNENDPISFWSICCLVMALQHPIFIAFRIPLLLVWTILTCCCDKGREYSESEDFKDRIISYDYVEYELENEVGGFENHAVGGNEVEWNRNISIVRERRFT